MKLTYLVPLAAGVIAVALVVYAVVAAWQSVGILVDVLAAR